MSQLDSFPWEETFFQENFNVDQCLIKLTQRANLDTLKSYMKNYGEELHRQMAEILKTETEAIVNLAEYLTNLDSKIEGLSVSLSQLREELKILNTLLASAQLDYRKTLESKTINDNVKNRLLAKLEFIKITLYVDNIIRLIENNDQDNLIHLERAVFIYSFQYGLLQELGIVETNSFLVSTENKLLNMVHKHFLKSLKEKDEHVIRQCLRMYNNLGKHKEAEEYYQNKIVRPFLQPMYNEKNLDRFNQDINKIFTETLRFLDSEMYELNKVVQKETDLKNVFNFILNSFWLEVDRQCRRGLPHITAPGNPELFQKRFVSTWNLLSEIARKCGDEKLMKTNPSFQEHIKRFNLAVYFEIRFQQIATQFESDLSITLYDSSIYIGDNDFGFKLKITLNLYVALKKCFNNTVFIDQLADHFLKFSMFLLSRYLKWFEPALEQKNGSIQWEELIVFSLMDMFTLIKLLGDKRNLQSSENMYAIFPKKAEPVIIKLMESNYKILNKSSEKLRNHLVSSKVIECSEQLQNVANIPRLFRRTNRSAPKEASNYMFEALKTISEFKNKFEFVENKILDPILDNIVSSITTQYSTLVQDVLQSVCKTEESLRRLKSRNTSANEDNSFSTSSETMTDEMKIREQIKLDINYFMKTLANVASTDTKSSLEQLGKNLS